MQRFKDFLIEHVISIGYNPKHEKHREQFRQQIHDILHHSYKQIGGYRGIASGSKEESDAIHNDISKFDIKATRRGDTITSVDLFKKSHGRKLIATGTDRSDQSRKDWRKFKSEDNEQKRSWAEVSGPMEKRQREMGIPVIPSSRAKELLNKDVEIDPNGEHYIRKINGHLHKKVMMGHTKPN